MNDIILFAVFPYLAVVVAIAGGVYRYRTNRFSYSTLSSQLLENRSLFWGSVPWHYGIVVVLLAHLLGFLMPGMWASITSTPAALYTIEMVGFAFGLAALVGLCVLIVRRFTTERILAVTSPMDGVLLVALLVQVALGIYVSLVYRWGADWYVDTAVPWLISLVSLNPQTQYVSSLPFGGQAAHAHRVRGDRPVPVLAAGASDNVPVLVLVAALSARDQKPLCQARTRKGPQRIGMGVVIRNR